MNFAQTLLDELEYTKFFEIDNVETPEINLDETTREVEFELRWAIRQELNGDLSPECAQSLINSV
jgi:hypothetical protein